MGSDRGPFVPEGASPQARGVTRGHGPLYEEGMDLDVVDVGDEECSAVRSKASRGSRVHWGPTITPARHGGIVTPYR